MDPSPDRRPVAARNLGVFRALASWMVRRHVPANAVSVAGMGAGILAGAALWATSKAPDHARWLWIAAAAMVQVRLLANMLDGMVAIESGTASKVGELYNEVPDRVSDTAVLVGLGYAAGGHVVWGWAAAVAAMMTAYVRTTGKGAGVPHDFCGPMAKQHRMFLVTGVSIAVAAAPGLRLPLGAWTPALPEATLVLIAAGSVLTSIRRLGRIAAGLRETP